jgi:hypothetical protein
VAWVTPYAGYFVVHGETAIGPQRLADAWPVLRELAASEEIDGVYAVTVGSLDGTLYRFNRMPEGFTREPLFEAISSADTRVSVARLDRPSDPLERGRDCSPPRS